MISFQKLRDYGVSPVVGVMLILVIMIVLVGVFALVATSLVSPGDERIDAEIQYLDTTSDGNYVFEMIAGEPFKKSRLKVVFRLRDDPTTFADRYTDAIHSTHADTVMLGDHLIVNTPTEFPTTGNYVVWMFYDTSSGNLISSGEIPPF